MKKIIIMLCSILLINSMIVSVVSDIDKNNLISQPHQGSSDYDPLVDIEITFEIIAIRALDKIEKKSDADFYLNLQINEEEFVSPVWDDTNYLYDCWSVTKNIPDDIENVNITLKLFDWDENEIKICDISKKSNDLEGGQYINLIYSIKTGHWFGDDYNVGDGSGYGRVCGTGDGSIYSNEYDCEIWFNIYQNDFDNDNLPYWIETYVYGSDPTINNTGEDNDSDGVPIEWEHRWGFNPNFWEDHENYDPDEDSINNIEEFLSSNFYSDPYRRDIFLEIDFMEDTPKGKSSIISKNAEELLKNPFNRRNIVFHLDTGQVCGGELIPYDDNVKMAEVRDIFDNFFLDNDESNWRRGVFHYGIIVYHCNPPGYAFSGDTPPYWGYIPGTNGFIISSKQMEKNARFLINSLDYYFSSAIMHEMGHNFGFRWGNPFGCDGQLTKYPWQIGYWIFRNYKSIMNYRYTYKIQDYSDGSHGNRDHNDWENIDLSYFEIPKI